MTETWLIELAHRTTPESSALERIDRDIQAKSDKAVSIRSVSTDFVGAEPITATVILVAVGTGVAGSGIVALIQEWIAAGRLKRANRQVLQALVLDELAGRGLRGLTVRNVTTESGFTRFDVSDDKEEMHVVRIAATGHILKHTG